MSSEFLVLSFKPLNSEHRTNTNALNKVTSPPPAPSPLEGEGWVGGKRNYCVCINNYVERYKEWLKIRLVKMDQLTTGLSDASGPSVTNSSFSPLDNNWYFPNTTRIV